MRLNQGLLWTAASFTLALSALPAWGIDEPPRPPASALGKIRDLAATVRARRLLQEDRVLGPLNLGVAVENGVVSLWGPVPSRDVARQAIAKMETIKGITDVRTNFYFKDNQSASTPERIATAKPEFETGKLPVPQSPPADEVPKVFAPRPVAAAARREPPASVVHLPKPADSLTGKVSEARQSEARFRAIAVDVQDTVVLVRRAASPPRDVMDLVQKLRRIPGVSDVILTND